MLALNAITTPGRSLLGTRRAWLGAMGAWCAAAGCGDLSSGSFARVLTSLSDEKLRPVLRGLGLKFAHVSRPTPSGDPVLAYERGAPADLLVGGPWWSYANRLGPAYSSAETRASAASPAGRWVAWGPTPVGLWIDDSILKTWTPGQSPWSLGGLEELNGRLSWADPRTEGGLLLAVASHLVKQGADGYGEIVRWVSCTQQTRLGIRDSGGVALPLAGWGDSESLEDGNGRMFIPSPETTVWAQGVAVVARANSALDFHGLFEDFDSWPVPGAGAKGESGTGQDLMQSAQGLALLGDLLHAVFGENWTEFHQAWSAIRRAPTPSMEGRELAERWILQPPPWPPASVELLKTRPAASLLLTELVTQLSSTKVSRAWLQGQFEGPARLVDASLLAEIGLVDDQGLVCEPRFRNWLRAEWSAWAGQRYRRAGRLAEGKVVGLA